MKNSAAKKLRQVPVGYLRVGETLTRKNMQP